MNCAPVHRARRDGQISDIICSDHTPDEENMVHERFKKKTNYMKIIAMWHHLDAAMSSDLTMRHYQIPTC